MQNNEISWMEVSRLMRLSSQPKLTKLERIVVQVANTIKAIFYKVAPASATFKSLSEISKAVSAASPIPVVVESLFHGHERTLHLRVIASRAQFGLSPESGEQEFRDSSSDISLELSQAILAALHHKGRIHCHSAICKLTKPQTLSDIRAYGYMYESHVANNSRAVAVAFSFKLTEFTGLYGR